MNSYKSMEIKLKEYYNSKPYIKYKNDVFFVVLPYGSVNTHLSAYHSRCKEAIALHQYANHFLTPRKESKPK